jgi:hypothetical protein
VIASVAMPRFIPFICSLWVGTVAAQSPLVAARGELDAGRFAEAVQAYDRIAAAESGLDPASLMQLLRDRALAHIALRDSDRARADLSALLSLDPRAEAGADASPSFQRLFDETRAGSVPLALRVAAEHAGDGYTISSTIVGDPAHVVRTVRVIELALSGPVDHEGTTVHIATDGSLRYVVEAIGWGGAVVARSGSLDEPREVGAMPVAQGEDLTGWIAFGIGAGVAVVAAIVTTVLVITVPSSSTRITFPMQVSR